MEKNMITIEYKDGKTENVELLTYLFSNDQQNTYIVYSKGEKSGTNQDEAIYVSKLVKQDGENVIDEITDDTEWASVQTLLKRIANAQ